MWGRHLYNTPVGNITWTVSPQTTILYQSATRIFSAHEPSAPSPTAVSTIINGWLMGLGITADGQNFQANPVAESVITFAVEPRQPTPPYLRLFEQMFQGIEVCPVNNFHFIHLLIVVPQATHIQLIYSTVPNPPSSCTLRAFPLQKFEGCVFPVLHIVIRSAEHTIWSTVVSTCASNFRKGKMPPCPQWYQVIELLRSTRVRDNGHFISGDDNQPSCFGCPSPFPLENY